MKKPLNIDEYMAALPSLSRELLQELRAVILKAVPGVKEVISYGMPAFKLERMVAWIAAHTNHIGFYPGASAIEAVKNDLTPYKYAKGSIQFPLDQPLPVSLIKKILKFRIDEIKRKDSLKKKGQDA